MRTAHVITAAILIGVATGLGTYAVTRTSELGVKARTTPKKVVDATVSAQTRRLNALETSLQKALATKPPALPRIPKFRPAPKPARIAYAAAPAPSPRVVVRSAAPVRTVRAAAPPARHGEQDHESQQRGSGGENGD